MELGRVVQFLHALESEGVEYVLVGAVALNVHGILRATQDWTSLSAPNARTWTV